MQNNPESQNPKSPTPKNDDDDICVSIVFKHVFIYYKTLVPKQQLRCDCKNCKFVLMQTSSHKLVGDDAWTRMNQFLRR